MAGLLVRNLHESWPHFLVLVWDLGFYAPKRRYQRVLGLFSSREENSPLSLYDEKIRISVETVQVGGSILWSKSFVRESGVAVD